MRPQAPGSGTLIGRRDEIRRIGELTSAARAGQGGVLVLRGEAGMGKTALLEHSRQVGSDFLVLDASGAEFESELPYASLHQLCLPALGFLAELPAQRREALRVAFGLASGTPDLFRVGLATLELLALAARERPLLCLIDDAQWLDAASSRALVFLARRISAEPVALVFAVRLPYPVAELAVLPGVDLAGLGDADARALLATVGEVGRDAQVRDRLLAESRGNPLALLTLPRSSGFAPSNTSSVPSQVERGFEARLAGLPADARLLLTIASADPTGDPGLLWPAAGRLNLELANASAGATATGLVEFTTRVRFCHPLARSAVYRTAEPGQRRAAHRVLAEVTDPVADPDRRAWHRAEASTGPDEDIAAELELSASRAQARGGTAAAAAFLERAAALTLDAANRIERTLAAAQLTLDAGAPDAAAEIVTTIERTALPEPQQARIDLLRGQIAFQRRTDSDGPGFMLRAAQRLAGLDPARSRDCYLDALEMALVVGRASGVVDVVLAAAKSAAQSAAPAEGPPDLLDALILLDREGHRAATPVLRAVLQTQSDPMWTRRPALGIVLAGEMWDPHLHQTIAEWLVKTGRESGSPLVLRLGLAQTASLGAFAGDFGQAMSAIAEEEAIADAIGAAPLLYPRLHLAAMRGRRPEAQEMFRTASEIAGAQGAGQLIANVHWAAAVVHNGWADYPAALAAAQQATAHGDLFLASISLPELVEAAVRVGQLDTAAAALESLTERTEAAATPTGLGVAAYARGLVTGEEDHYRQAIKHLDDSPLLPYRARAQLLYGEWLRRQNRRRECRQHLRTAHELLSEVGLEAFAQRATHELRATGETARSRPSRTDDHLTMQEKHIARLVATGATSNEVAAQLFLSPRTIDAHLRNIFRKLGITSRRQLRSQPDLGH